METEIIEYETLLQPQEPQNELYKFINLTSNILYCISTSLALFDCIFNCVLTFSFSTYLWYAAFNVLLILLWCHDMKQIMIPETDVTNSNRQNFHKRERLLISFNLFINLWFILLIPNFILKTLVSSIICSAFIVIHTWFIYIYQKLIRTSLKSPNIFEREIEIQNIKKQIKIMNLNSQLLFMFLSPKAILNSTIEKVSSSSIPLPTPSISALNTINEHILYLTNQLMKSSTDQLNYSTIDDISIFDIGSLIQNIIDSVSGIANKKNIEICVFYTEKVLKTKFLGNKEMLIHLLLYTLSYIVDNSASDIYCTLELVDHTVYNIVFLISYYQLEINFTEFKQETMRLSQTIGGIVELKIDGDKVDMKLSFSLHTIGGQIMDELIFTPTSEYDVNPVLLKSTEANSPTICSEVNDVGYMMNYIKNKNIELYSIESSRFGSLLMTILMSWDIRVYNHIIYDAPKSTPLAHSSKAIVATSGQSSASSYSENRHISYFKLSGNNTVLSSNDASPDNKLDQSSSSNNKTIIVNDHIPTLSRLLVAIANDLSSPYNTYRKTLEPDTPCSLTLLVFVSLTHYKKMKESVRALLNTPSSLSYPLVMIVPKPAGPKRILASVYYSFIKHNIEYPYIPNVMAPGVAVYFGDKRRENSGLNASRTNTAKRSVKHSAYDNNKNQMPELHTKSKSLSKVTTKNRPYFGSRTKSHALLPETTPENINDEMILDHKNVKLIEEKLPKTAPIKLLKGGLAAKKKNLIGEINFPPIKILIVEDNPINLTIMINFMKKRKIEHSTATNGKQAVDMFQNHEFHFVLMDIQLPVMSGIDAAKEIRKIELEKKDSYSKHLKKFGSSTKFEGLIPSASPVIIIALTASSLTSDRDEALTAGCNDFLTKPLSYIWLEKKIVEWGSMQALILSGQPILDSKKLENRKQKVAKNKKSNITKVHSSKNSVPDGKKSDKVEHRSNSKKEDTKPNITKSEKPNKDINIREPILTPSTHPNEYFSTSTTPNSTTNMGHSNNLEVIKASMPSLLRSPSDNIESIPKDIKDVAKKTIPRDAEFRLKLEKLD